MCTKYGRSRMNDAHTASPTDPVGCPTKVVRSTALFSKKKTIFVRLLCRPLAIRPAGGHRCNSIKFKHMDTCVLRIL